MDDYTMEIEEIAKACYSNKKQKANFLFNDFLSTLSINDKNTENLLPVFNNMLEALENNDLISLADYLLFELKPLFNNESIPNELLGFSVDQLPEVNANIFYYASLLDDEPVLCIKKNNIVYNINSYFSPLNQTEFVFGALDMKKNTPVVCLFGIGTGLLAEKILNRLGFDGKLIVFEPERTIINYCTDCIEEDNCSDIEKRVLYRIKKVLEDNRTVLCVEEENALLFSRTIDALIDYTGLVGLKVINNPGYTRVYPQSSELFAQVLKDFEERMITNINTYTYFSEDFLENPLKNISLCKKAYLCSDLRKVIPQEIPIFIVSAGPSLDKNIKLLKELKGHSLIFAVDTALKYLLNESIIPDLTITIDARKSTGNFAIERTKTIPCIFSGKSNPAIVREQKGELIYLDGQEGYIDGLLESLGKKTIKYLGTGGSVATAAFAVAYMLKSKYIILLGQDLAYSGENSHAGGVKEKTLHKDSYVEDIYGNSIRTRSDWVGYIKWLEDSIKLIKESKEEIRVIDATEGGAKIHGSEIMTLREVINLLMESNNGLPVFDFSLELNKLSPLLIDDEYEKMCSKHKSSINSLKVLCNEIEEAIRICNNLLVGIEAETVSSSFIHKQNKRLTEIREHLEKHLMYILIQNYIAGKDLSEIADLELQEGNIQTIQSNLIKAMKIFFETHLKALKVVYEKAKSYEYLL